MTLYLAFVKLMMIYKVRKQNYTDIQQKKKNEKRLFICSYNAICKKVVNISH